MTEERLSHVDPQGQARMIDVSEKPNTRRTAVAVAECVMNLETADAVRQNSGRKGDVLGTARLAAIMGAKRTAELIPLCHSLPLEQVDVDFQWLDPQRLGITVSATATAKTGVEMEALTGASLAALTVYDMCKSSDRAIRIEAIQLQSKQGGARGDYQRSEGPVCQ